MNSQKPNEEVEVSEVLEKYDYKTALDIVNSNSYDDIYLLLYLISTWKYPKLFKSGQCKHFLNLISNKSWNYKFLDYNYRYILNRKIAEYRINNVKNPTSHEERLKIYCREFCKLVEEYDEKRNNRSN